MQDAFFLKALQNGFPRGKGEVVSLFGIFEIDHLGVPLQQGQPVRTSGDGIASGHGAAEFFLAGDGVVGKQNPPSRRPFLFVDFLQDDFRVQSVDFHSFHAPERFVVGAFPQFVKKRPPVAEPVLPVGRDLLQKPMDKRSHLQVDFFIIVHEGRRRNPENVLMVK